MIKFGASKRSHAGGPGSHALEHWEDQALAILPPRDREVSSSGEHLRLAFLGMCPGLLVDPTTVFAQHVTVALGGKGRGDPLKMRYEGLGLPQTWHPLRDHEKPIGLPGTALGRQKWRTPWPSTRRWPSQLW